MAAAQTLHSHGHMHLPDTSSRGLCVLHLAVAEQGPVKVLALDFEEPECCFPQWLYWLAFPPMLHESSCSTSSDGIFLLIIIHSFTYLLVTWDRVSLHSPNWPGTWDPSAFASCSWDYSHHTQLYSARTHCSNQKSQNAVGFIWSSLHESGRKSIDNLLWPTEALSSIRSFRKQKFLRVVGFFFFFW
jgi:hypothetical protein